jgi:2-polyprenyl-6-methoxyphenol hydroxylase-like FAD-dependent oxidoreductase
MRAEVTDLIEEGGRVGGVRATTPDGALEVRAALVVGCDGRHSTVRKKAGLIVEELGAPMDVLWFRVSRPPGDPEETMGLFLPGRILVMIERGNYWQCAYVIPKGSIEDVQGRGIESFRAAVEQAVPFLKGRMREIEDWDQIKLLTVAVDRLKRWHRSGLLCIGDAAHAMSPIGGVGVNLAVQDAVAAANILAEPLRAGPIDDGTLQKVQDRREFPTRVTQRIQLFLQNNVIRTVLRQSELKPPLVLRLLQHCPVLRRIPARVLGLGVRPEHIGTAERI